MMNRSFVAFFFISLFSTAIAARNIGAISESPPSNGVASTIFYRDILREAIKAYLAVPSVHSPATDVMSFAGKCMHHALVVGRIRSQIHPLTMAGMVAKATAVDIVHSPEMVAWYAANTHTIHMSTNCDVVCDRCIVNLYLEQLVQAIDIHSLANSYKYLQYSQRRLGIYNVYAQGTRQSELSRQITPLNMITVLFRHRSTVSDVELLFLNKYFMQLLDM